MTYEQAVDYINSTPKFTTKNKAENTIELIRRLGNPQDHMKVIHVAGTNGKGSVCAFLSNMLVAGGKRTGLFISPHLVKINERFQINNVPVSDEEFLNAYHEVEQVIKEMIADGFFHPTYFEILFAITMVIFRDQKCEYVVLETGLGGRLDATNIVEHPIAAVIASISLDHTEILGETITAIAGEKAGIIKKEIPVVFDGRNKEAESVLLQKAEEMQSPASALHEDMYTILSNTETSIDYQLHIPYYEGSVVTVPYVAPYQVVNSSLALLAMETIDPSHEISKEVRLEAIRQTKWQGRMETVLPGIIVDGAHNEDGVAEFVRTLKQLREGRRIVLLFSAVVEKNYEQMVKTICDTGCFDEAVITEIKGSRIVPAKTLADVFRKYTDAVIVEETDIDTAFEIAKEHRQDGILFCVGSLYLVGEVKRVIEEKAHDQL